VVGSARLVTLALVLATGVGCGSLHQLTEYYPDSGVDADSASDTGLDDTGGPDTQVDDTDTGNPDTDTGPVDTDTGGGGTVCTNTCSDAGDGWCDDGGPGSDFSICAFGTDCADCGPRSGSGDTGGSGACNDDCMFYADGECDDGGPGAMWDLCDLGTDCTDCGPR